MTGWHLVKTECRNGVWSVILLWHYLEQQKAQRDIAHTQEKVTEKNGKQQQIASPAHYWSFLPQCYPVWHAGGPMWTIGSDLGQEQVNLVWVLPSSQHNLFSCLFDLLRWKRKRKKKEMTLFRIFAVFNFWLYTYLKPRCEYIDNDTLKCDI